ncbi:MAG: cyclic pyranopterin monophosphate synthase MoaC [Coriobacteriales bacterium]|jgi:cyclic pyranopterin phosphate synthase|nr:cyclic pyranopterin monophosphate synthase MoaC [Coriobacteriales bacterium]
MSKLTHLDSQGQARMVDIGAKLDSSRTAVARGFVAMMPATLSLIVEGQVPKGDVFATARIAGIMAAKRAPDLIPLCHPLLISKSALNLSVINPGERADGKVGIQVQASLGVIGKTGIEMEALTAVSVACLTIYDMCKAVDRGMEISEIRLLKKDGGASGLWLREASLDNENECEPTGSELTDPAPHPR